MSQREADAAEVKKTARLDEKKIGKWTARLLKFAWLPLALLLVALQRLLALNPQLTENLHTGGIFYILSWPLLRISSLVPFSLTEVLVVVVLPLTIVFLAVRAIFKIIKNRQDRLKRFFNGLNRVAWVLTIFLLVFMLMHGFNYSRLPAAEIFNLPVKERPADDLAATANWLTKEAALLRENLSEDEHGVFVLSGSIKETMLDVNAAYDAAEVDWPALRGHSIRPKGVLLSHYWSYTGITGVYNPFLVEANVNIDQPAYSLPDTIAHEVAHTRGFAREDEANFVAFLTGMYSQNSDYRYSVMLDTWIRITNRLYTADKEAYEQVASGLTDAMRRDLTAGSLYWKQFEGPVQEVSDQANNLYLQANMQSDGVASYGRMIDLVLAWFEVKQS
ncbi:MAG: hypothetical protein PWP10_2653 [Clostridiales bacterium]|jgi:hypothetical protein|nr:hypothetical protein [Clostridiales bacterium]